MNEHWTQHIYALHLCTKAICNTLPLQFQNAINYKCPAVAQTGDRLATINMGEK